MVLTDLEVFRCEPPAGPAGGPGNGGERPLSPQQPAMGGEEVMAETLQKAVVFGSASFTGAALMEKMAAAGYDVEAGQEASDALSADVIVCNTYGNDTVRAAPYRRVVSRRALAQYLKPCACRSRLNCRTPNACCPSWPAQIWRSPSR